MTLEEQLVKAAQEGRAAGIAYGQGGEHPTCPYAAGSLPAHVWIRWMVHARLSTIGVPN